METIISTRQKNIVERKGGKEARRKTQKRCKNSFVKFMMFRRIEKKDDNAVLCFEFVHR
jgi:hypothetical protein